MPEMPMFSVDTPRRCFGLDRDATSSICNRRACWMLAPVNGAAASFYCDLHRRQGVVPIALDVPFRRITLTVDVLLSASSLMSAAAHQEAVATILDALVEAGAVPNLVAITSTIGRFSPSPAPGATNRLLGHR
jgi:hypothetical protein